jgi:hypothetical protein
MRTPSLAALLAGLSVISCAHSAYGPSSDQRLEDATSSKLSTEGADVATVRCADLIGRAQESKSEERPEADRLNIKTEVFTAARERHTKLDDAVTRNPDLIYSANGETIKANRDECQSLYADARSDLDRFVRELCEPLLIQDISGKTVARIDFAVIRNALEALGPEDKDALLAKIDAAEKRVGAARPAAKPQGRKGSK